MPRVMVIVVGLLVAVANVGAVEVDIKQSAQLMQICRAEPVACDLLIQTNLDNIRFFAALDDQAVMNDFFSIHNSSCLADLTALEVRLELQGMYADLDYAKLGASQMIFNSVAAAAANRCRGEAI